MRGGSGSTSLIQIMFEPDAQMLAVQAGDAELEASVGAMQQVIELARTLRERRSVALCC